MALEAIVFQQDPFTYNCKDYSYDTKSYDDHDFVPFVPENLDITECSNYYIYLWDSPPSSSALISQHSPAGLSPKNLTGAAPSAGNVFHATGAAPSCRRKRRRTKTVKNKEEMENQRMTHIAVERNRRRQMNDYLAILRSLMPPSYSQRGDQASIVGGAINFVKELEQLLQSLEGPRKNTYDPRQPNTACCNNSNPLASFFSFPQYTTSPSNQDESCDNNISMDPISMERRSDLADIEVAVVDTHANIKILTKTRLKQLLKMVSGFQSLGLTILHLNVTTVDQYVLYTFSVKVEEECQLTTVNEIATGVHDIVGMIQQETAPSMSI